MSGPGEMRLFDREDDEPRARRVPRATRDQADQADQADRVTEPIQAGLGQVTVDLGGELVDIRFTERALRAMRPDVVGDYIAAAINNAGEVAAAVRATPARAERGQ